MTRSKSARPKAAHLRVPEVGAPEVAPGATAAAPTTAAATATAAAPTAAATVAPMTPTAAAPGATLSAEPKLRPARNWISRLLFYLGILLIIAALVIAGFLFFRYYDAQNRYREISTVSGLEVPLLEAVVDPDLRLEDIHFDWDALRAANPDVVAWIIIPGTHINYPIVQGPDNEYYLHHLFDASYNNIGAVFLDHENSPELDDRNNIAYGHNVFDGSMFTDLVMFKDQDYFNQHTVVYLCTPNLNQELRPFAILQMDENAPLRRFGFGTNEEFANYLNEMLDSAVVSADGPSAAELAEGRVYSFVTCDSLDFSQRVVLICQPVRSAEPS
jgi:sortase B